MHYAIGGSGPTLVLLPGWPETWWEWHYMMPTLARNHTVIAFDLPGLGCSTIPSGGYDAATTGRRIHEAVNALGFKHVGVLAHGLSVLGAFDYARDYPSEVTRLGVMESPLNGFGLEKYCAIALHCLFNQAPAPLPEDMLSDRLAKVAYINYMFTEFVHNHAGVDRDLDVYYADYANPANFEASFDYFRAFPQNEANNLANASHKLTLPVLAMGGQYSFGAAIGPAFDKVATDVHTVVAPGAAHYIPEETPGFLSECAELFFSSSANPKPPSSEYDGCVP
jgi:pimeloyl-ACP methyl ester carboxylesterase